MKVLVTGFEWFGDLVPFVVRGLAGLSDSVEVIFTNPDGLVATRDGLLRTIETVPIAGHSLAGRWRTRLTRRAHADINERFRRAVDRVKPDIVLSILCWGESLTCESLLSASRATRIGWLMDDPFAYERSQLDKLLTAFDRLYSADDGWGDNVERMTGRRPVWLPCGADPASHAPIAAALLDPDLRNHIVYVGSSCVGHPAGIFRRTLLEALKGLPLAIFGDPGWRQYGGFVASSYRGGPIDSQRANAIYGSGAIALNFHHPQFRRGTSLRTFALCCSGAFQIVDWRDGLDRWFTSGVEIETFRTPSDLRRLAERYLGDSAARAAIAAAGRKRVLAEHTYKHRLERMLADIHSSSFNAGSQSRRAI